LEIDNTNMESESKDEGEEKRDWMYTDDKERDMDIRDKKGSNQDKDIRSRLNSNQGRGKGGSGRGRGFVRQGIVGDKLRKSKLSGVRKVRVAPPRSDLEKGRAKSVRTLPPSLYNNPDALSSKSRLVGY